MMDKQWSKMEEWRLVKREERFRLKTGFRFSLGYVERKILIARSGEESIVMEKINEMNVYTRGGILFVGKRCYKSSKISSNTINDRKINNATKKRLD